MAAMIDLRQWIYSRNGRRVTADEIGAALGISRTSATRRLVANQFNASEIITLCRTFDISPLQGLITYGHLTETEVWAHLDASGQLVETAEDGALALELARRLNPATRAEEIADIKRHSPLADEGRRSEVTSLERRRKQRDQTIGGTSTPPVVTEDLYAADSSLDEDELRWERGEEPID
ncbi:hypothetical protein CXB45_08640 [Corynebacterium mastitidis]|uniref:Immunity repressor n=2 Tax=Corynebacterium mastitidis TaxID=161890 RepID=A0A2N0X624_9CORY|nr:hypothetical protein CXB45_08640 [Corynebacterium mastitidis]